MRLTAEQLEIVAAARSGGHLRVKAFAGTGKTTTLRAAAEALADKRVLYLAFNRSTMEEAEGKFPRGVKVSTAHGLAYRETVARFGKARLKNSLMPTVRRVQGLPEIDPVRQPYKGDGRAAALVVVQTLTRWAQSDRTAPAPEDVPAAFAAKFGGVRRSQEAARVVSEASSEVWERMFEPGSTVPITHDFYLKLWALSEPRLPFDTVLFDEAQDANPVMLKLVTKQDAQQVYVGDSHQQIYRFRGAVDAMRKAPGEEFPLTKSWRFGREIAEQANEVLAILGERLRLEGGGPAGAVSNRPSARPEDAVLCRGNTGVLREVLAGLDGGRRVAVVGGTKETARLLHAAYELYVGKKTGHPELGIFASWGELEEFSQTDEGSSYRQIVRAVEGHRHSVPDLCRRLEHGTEADERRAETLVSTAHKAKGREWQSVRFCDDFPPLVEVGEGGRKRLNRDEANLVYVSITRAMGHLNLAGYGATLREAARQARAPHPTVSVQRPPAPERPPPKGSWLGRIAALATPEGRRRARGEKLHAGGKVERVSDDEFWVAGTDGAEYAVRLTCECADAARGRRCEHVFGVLRALTRAGDKDHALRTGD